MNEPTAVKIFEDCKFILNTYNLQLRTNERAFVIEKHKNVPIDDIPSIEIIATFETVLEVNAFCKGLLSGEKSSFINS
jgi:hypothetical protein